MDRPIRFVLTQPALPSYRIPVFRELAARPTIDLRVAYAKEPDLSNVAAAGFRAYYIRDHRMVVGRQHLVWSGAQLSHAYRGDVDVLGMTWNTRCLSLLPALMTARARGLPTVLWGQGFAKHDSQLREQLRIRTGKLATAIVVYSERGAQWAINRGIDKNKVFVALNTLDQRPIQKARGIWLHDPDRIAEFRLRENLGNRPIVLFVSRLKPQNRLELLLEAMQKLQTTVPGITAVIVGQGQAEARLKRRSIELGVGDRVRFIGPLYDETALAGWMTSADVFCYPAGIGLSLLHAFGYGLPVITSDNIGMHGPEIEALEPGVNGLLFRDGDPASLAETVERLILDKRLAARLGRAAHDKAANYFTLERMVDGLEAAVNYAARSDRDDRGRRSRTR